MDTFRKAVAIWSFLLACVLALVACSGATSRSEAPQESQPERFGQAQTAAPASTGEVAPAAASPAGKRIQVTPPGYTQAGPPPSPTSPPPSPTLDPLAALQTQDTAGPFVWLPDGKTLAVSSQTGLRLLDTASGRVLKTLAEGHFRAGNLVARGNVLAADGAPAASGGSSVQAWDLAKGAPEASGELIFSVDKTGLDIQSLALSPDGTILATGELQRIRLWDLPSGSLRGEIPIDEVLPTPPPVMDGFVPDLAFTPDGQRLVGVIQYRAIIRAWDVQTLDPVRSVEIPRDVLAFTLSPDAAWLAVEYNDYGFELWDLGAFRSLRDYPQALGAAGWLNFSPDASQVVVWGYSPPDASGTVSHSGASVWDLSDGKQVHEFPHPDRALGEWQYAAFSPDGRALSVSDNYGYIYFYALPGGLELGKIYLPYQVPPD